MQACLLFCGGARMQPVNPYNRLSPRRREVFHALLDSSDPAKVIAYKLGITHNTVTQHIEHIYRTFNVHSRVELMRYVRDHRILEGVNA